MGPDQGKTTSASRDRGLRAVLEAMQGLARLLSVWNCLRLVSATIASYSAPAEEAIDAFGRSCGPGRSCRAWVAQLPSGLTAKRSTRASHDGSVDAMQRRFSEGPGLDSERTGATGDITPVPVRDPQMDAAVTTGS